MGPDHAVRIKDGRLLIPAFATKECDRFAHLAKDGRHYFIVSYVEHDPASRNEEFFTVARIAGSLTREKYDLLKEGGPEALVCTSDEERRAVGHYEECRKQGIRPNECKLFDKDVRVYFTVEATDEEKNRVLVELGGKVSEGIN